MGLCWACRAARGPGCGERGWSACRRGRAGLLPLPRRRLDYVNHARRLAEDDWAGLESEGEDKEGEDAEEEEMDVDTGKKLPKRYANQVGGCLSPWVGSECERGVVDVGCRAGIGMAALGLTCPAWLGAQGGIAPQFCLPDTVHTDGGWVEMGCLRALGNFSSAGSVCILLCST